MNICLGPGVTYLFVGLTCALNSVDYMHFKEQVWVPTTPRLFPLTVFMIFLFPVGTFFFGLLHLSPNFTNIVLIRLNSCNYLFDHFFLVYPSLPATFFHTLSFVFSLVWHHLPTSVGANSCNQVINTVHSRNNAGHNNDPYGTSLATQSHPGLQLFNFEQNY